MPRDSAGVMSLPPSTWATSGQTIAVNQHNPPMREIEQALTDSLPRNGAAGMTGNLPMAGNRITGLGAPVNPDDAVSLSYASGITPIGVIADFAGDNAPAGWMLCFGQAVNRSTEADLFAVIGTKFGAGNGTTTFNLPDYRGRVGVGKDNMGGTSANRMSFFGALANTIGAAFGTDAHVLTEAQMPSHQHAGETNDGGNHYHDYPGPATGNNYGGSRPTGSGGNGFLQTLWAGIHRHIFATDWRGGNQPHTNTQPSIVINKIIRVK